MEFHLEYYVKHLLLEINKIKLDRIPKINEKIIIKIDFGLLKIASIAKKIKIGIFPNSLIKTISEYALIPSSV